MGAAAASGAAGRPAVDATGGQPVRNSITDRMSTGGGNKSRIFIC